MKVWHWTVKENRTETGIEGKQCAQYALKHTAQVICTGKAWAVLPKSFVAGISKKANVL